MNKYVKKFFSIFGFTFGYALNIVILAVCVYAVYRFSIKGFEAGQKFAQGSSEERPYEEVSLTVQEGTTLREMAGILKNEGIIYNAMLYELENILKGNSDPYVAGTFVVNNQMKTSEINRALRTVIVKGVDRKITISEGRSIREIAQYLENEEIVSAEDFIETCNTGDFKYEFLRDIPDRENRLEGYLFPDTYFIAENATSSHIIDKMLSRFEEMYDAECAQKALEMGLTMDEVITIASIIEKEINRDDERAKAASVIYNRLESKINLQMCSTIIYILGKPKERLLDEDLQVESPYNTYIHSGLPEGPIANPGKDCITAALNPVESNLLYFVVKDENTGEHVFTGDYNEFLNAKALYNQKF